MEETSSGFGERPARSAIRIVHVLFEGTHCVQQQPAFIPQSDTHSARVGSTHVTELTFVTFGSGNPSEKFQNFAKFRAVAVSVGSAKTK